MTNYINPFEKRTFSERFKAVFAFIKQNFVQVMKFYLLVFAAIAALVSWFETIVPDSSQNNLGRIVAFVAFAYFTHYIANRGDMRTVSFKEMWKSMGGALGKMVEASLLPMGLTALFVLVFVVYFLAMILIVGGGFDNVNGVFLVIVFLPLLVFVLYIIPIFSIYYIHFYFSSSLKDSYDTLEESFRMVKGHWWSTMGFIVVFEILQLVVLLPVILILLEKGTFISGWIGNLLIFIVSFFTAHVVTLYQYGHLKALREEQGEEKTKIITTKGIVVAVGILLLTVVGAFFTKNDVVAEIQRKNEAESAQKLMKAADEGDAAAQYELGLCYLDGKGVALDSLECFSWISKSAAQGNVDALNQLAYCYAEGVGTDADMGMAHATIDKAIQMAPDDANLYDSKGEFYMMVGDREKAQEMYDKVVAMDSTFYAHHSWAKLYDYINKE